MKKYLIIIALALFLFSCDKGDELRLKGQVTNLTTPYILATFSSSDTLAIDTIHVSKKGKFNFNAKIDTLTVLTLYFNDFSSSCVIFADKGNDLNVKGDANLPDLIQVKGNEINDDLSSFKETNHDLLFQRGELYNNFRSGDADNAVNKNELKTQLNSLNYELTQKAEEFVKGHPEKTASLIIINNFFRNPDNPQALDRVLGYLNKDILSLPMGLSLKNYSEKLKKSAEGMFMPYFNMKDINGKEIKSTDLRGKHTILNFLSSTDIESRETVKILKNEYASLNKDSVNFVSIYIDSDIYPITNMENDSIPWTVIPDKKGWASEMVKSYNVPFVPYNILISPSGNIQQRNIPTQEVKEIIKDKD
ncbi:MAG: DUF4369 domain-containing protein [Dysgonamonadaceae bacterium]|jgi:peroxiredoxin/TM2 domain-containing membrane protein YozV|nr:DUF4369 domain-containing protein [Dysgonamonadaceae bacterium]MDD3309526.1 DUF4369 domain-containing protein [Dysgonamonadaceae bacterium]MDD3899843.1 DUF4369 domain-containing protein [Dysgonamonadaceae bacterium]MDD4398541.1 DUF4369 domain-containing protein [Dysgonamonadaceae bacterium]MEA5080888.1 DUF4369 domain-containing protein [Dysgonamonadaceae bacterium]